MILICDHHMIINDHVIVDNNMLSYSLTVSIYESRVEHT